MAVPRPLLLALVGVILLSGAFLATRNMRHESSAPSHSATPTHKPAPKPAANPRGSGRPVNVRSSRPKVHAAAPARHPSARRHAARKAAGAPARKPAAMARAIARGHVVVLFLFQPSGGDDDRVAKSLSAVRGERGVTVLKDTIEHVGRYAPMVGDLDVSEAPAIVIVDRHRRGHLIEGYVDSDTLRQEIADIRR